jgi:nicotinamide mononucleotide (NMN) deamidase PncC
MANEMINTLLCIGCETIESIDSLIGFTKLSSEQMRKALIYNYVNGMEADLAISITGVKSPNFTRDSNIIIEVARKIAAHNELKYTNQLTDN